MPNFHDRAIFRLNDSKVLPFAFRPNYPLKLNFGLCPKIDRNSTVNFHCGKTQLKTTRKQQTLIEFFPPDQIVIGHWARQR